MSLPILLVAEHSIYNDHMLNDQISLNGSTSLSYKKGNIRFLLLALIVLVAFANEYSFNNPQALEDALREHLQISQTQFQLFYSLYSLPNIFTLLLVGYLLDKFGMRAGIVILSGALVLCQLLFAIGGQIQSYSMMLFSRILFGIASRSLFIPQTGLISFWFKGKELSFAMGIGITFPELGNALNSYLTPLIYEWSGSLGAPLFTSVFLCLLGFLGSLFVFKIDKKAQQFDINNDYQSQQSQYSLDTADSKHQTIKLSDLKQLSNTFWIVSVLCTLTMAQYIPFLDNANLLFQKRFCFTRTTAGEVVTVTYLATALFSGPLGILVNKIGLRRYFIIAATLIFFAAHTIIWLYPQCESQPLYSPAWGLLLVGIGYSFYANVIVASIPLVVKRKVLGSALAIMQILSSLIECIIPIVTGFLIERGNDEEGYKSSSFFFFVTGLTAVFSSLPLLCIESKMKKRLDKGEGKLSISPEALDDIEVPSEYKRIQDQGTDRNSTPSNRSSFLDYFKKRQSVGIQLQAKQLY